MTVYYQYVEVPAHCTIGAIGKAREELHVSTVVEAAAEIALKDFLHVDHIPRWNDNDAEDEHEVIETLRLTAKGLRNSVSE